VNTVQIMAEYARLADVHKASDLLVAMHIISRDDQILMIRKFMDDRPAFKQHVADAMGGKVIPPSTRSM